MATDDFTYTSRLLSRTVAFKKNTARYSLVAFLIALGLHLIGGGLILYTKYGQYDPKVPVRMLPYEPLVQREKPIELMNEPKELIDVPERLRSEKKPDKPTPNIADKNAIAMNRQVDPTMLENLPFAEGEQSDMKTIEEPEEGDQQHDPMGGTIVLAPRTSGMPDFSDAEEVPKWNPDLLLRPEFRGKSKEKEKQLDIDQSLDKVDRELVVVPLDDLDERKDKGKLTYKKHGKVGFGIGPGRLNPTYQNKVTVAKDFGDFSFSTVAWDYAPYLYELRERIRRNWYPPPAFRMGIVSGRVKVNFKIMPDGELRDFQVLSIREEEDTAYNSLVKSSTFAVQGSAPFVPLPYDFPEPFLEITGTFYYRILDRQ